jgi:DNA transposition AAA+ family ATPase
MNIQGLKQYVEVCIKRCGSATEIARKCGISASALSLFRSGKYGAKEDNLAETIAMALGYRESNWNVVETVVSYQQVATCFKAAKEESLWMGISSKAGIGKTEALRDMYTRSSDDSVIFIQCSEWNAHRFMLEIYEKVLGKCERYLTAEKMKTAVVSYLYSISEKKPVLLIDEADKLKPSSMATLIDLYNRTESFVGALFAGTDNLEETIKRGASRAKKNMDEIDSRLGRQFIHLLGATKKDVFAICAANGVTDEVAQEKIWGDVDKEQKEVSETHKRVWFTDDMRRLTRLIKRERVQAKIAAKK